MSARRVLVPTSAEKKNVSVRLTNYLSRYKHTQNAQKRQRTRKSESKKCRYAQTLWYVFRFVNSFESLNERDHGCVQTFLTFFLFLFFVDLRKQRLLCSSAAIQLWHLRGSLRLRSIHVVLLHLPRGSFV